MYFYKGERCTECGKVLLGELDQAISFEKCKSSFGHESVGENYEKY